ncbi:AbrB/MazE/SpoVT family DNA-binding domain-containing protein [Candidatus Bathyarchaeota archaeon]|nr:AbrB/MazE/SpoVT family DNA-binding domain-containing protein [Candidatus Bathyarchaeota archaeon]
MSKTVVSKKGQVVIPKQARDKLGLTPGTVLKVQVEGKRIILEALQEPPKETFIEAGSTITEQLLNEAKTTSDKSRRLLRDLGVSIA